MIRSFLISALIALTLTNSALADTTACELPKTKLLEKLESTGFTQHRMFTNKAELNKIADVLAANGIPLPPEYNEATDAAGFINMNDGSVLLVFYKGPCVILGGRLSVGVYRQILDTTVADDTGAGV